MVPRALGRTGLSVGPIGLGTVKLGRNTGVKYPASFELPTDDEVRALLEGALAMGVTLIDTAPAYGTSEERLAPFLRAHRDDIVLCTKAGERFEDGGSTHDFSGDAIRASLDSSLRRLGTDRVDLLLLHSDGRDLPILRETDAVAALRRLKEAGKTRAIGISAKTQEGVLEACQSLDVVMAPYSPADRSLAGALGIAHDSGLGVIAIKGLAQGRFEGTAAEAVSHVLSRSFVDCLVVGTLNPAHLREVVEAAG